MFKNVQDGDVFSQIHQVRNNKNDGYLEQWVYNLNPPSKRKIHRHTTASLGQEADLLRRLRLQPRGTRSTRLL